MAENVTNAGITQKDHTGGVNYESDSAASCNNYGTSETDETADEEVAHAINTQSKRTEHAWSRNSPSGSRSCSRSWITDFSKKTYASKTSYLSYPDISDTEGLLVEHGVRTEYDAFSTATRHKRKRRGHGWTRRKCSHNYRSCSPRTTYSRASRKTIASATSRANLRTKQLLREARAKSIRLKNMFNDILAEKGPLQQYTEAHLIADEACYEFDKSDDENAPVYIVKTRCAIKHREKLIENFKEEVFNCSDCGMVCLGSEEGTKHMIEEHNHKLLYVCRECGQRFVSISLRDLHKETQHYIHFKAYCLFCSKYFEDKADYEAHMDLYLTNSYSCIYCGKVYLHKYSYKSHVRKRHRGKKFLLKPPPTILDKIVSKKFINDRINQEDHNFDRILIQDSSLKIRYNNSPLEFVKSVLIDKRINLEEDYYANEIVIGILQQYSTLGRHRFPSLTEYVDAVMQELSSVEEPL